MNSPLDIQLRDLPFVRLFVFVISGCHNIFQIDFDIIRTMIRTMRRENFSFIFAENIGKFVILRRDIREIRSFCKFCGVGLNVQRTMTEFEIVGAQKF